MTHRSERACGQTALWITDPEYDCESKCEIFHECGGGGLAPCGCIYKGTEKAYQCDRCHLICREWRSTEASLPSKEWLAEVEEGLPLSLVIPNGRRCPELPLLIPTLADRIQCDTRLGVRFVGVQLESVLNDPTEDGSASIQGWVKAGRYGADQRVVDTAEPILLLHGDDPLLEAFWGLPHSQVLSMIQDLGCRIVTGPTFSVYGDNTNWPPAQSVMMMLRHHRYVQELYDQGLVVAPNLYWRRRAEADGWLAWLRRHEEVSVVSRDFSMMKQPGQESEWLAEFRTLTELLSHVPRSLHILLLGIGEGKARIAIEGLAELGHTCSIVSSQYVMLASRGVSVVDGTRAKDHVTDRGALAQLNLAAIEERLVDLTRGIDLYDPRSLRNLIAA